MRLGTRIIHFSGLKKRFWGAVDARGTKLVTTHLGSRNGVVESDDQDSERLVASAGSCNFPQADLNEAAQRRTLRSWVPGS